MLIVLLANHHLYTYVSCDYKILLILRYVHFT